jgi:hypothetical protein
MWSYVFPSGQGYQHRQLRAFRESTRHGMLPRMMIMSVCLFIIIK